MRSAAEAQPPPSGCHAPLPLRLSLAAGIALLVAAIHGGSGVVTSFDSQWVIASAQSLMRYGDFDLDEYRPQAEAVAFQGLRCVEAGGKTAAVEIRPGLEQPACAGHLHYYYPLAVPVLTAPLLYGAQAYYEHIAPALRSLAPGSGAAARPPFHSLLETNRLAIERLAASVFIALAAAFVFLSSLEELPLGWSAAMAFTFAFTTPAWSTGSRALWQHTLSMPLLAATLWLLSAARRKPGLAVWAGLTLMTAFWVRPTNILGLGFYSLYVLAFHRAQLAGYLAAMGPPLLLFGGINHSIYGSPLPPYANASRASSELSLHPGFVEALAANLASPARGLFVFTPLFLLSGIGLCRGDAEVRLRWLRRVSAVLCAAHWILVSSFGHWWGGHCFGPRFFSDLTPVFLFLLIPAVQRIRSGSRALAILALLLAAIGGFIHSQGALRQEVIDWNAKPVDIDRSPARIWDWRDPPFLRAVRERRTEAGMPYNRRNSESWRSPVTSALMAWRNTFTSDRMPKPGR